MKPDFGSISEAEVPVGISQQDPLISSRIKSTQEEAQEKEEYLSEQMNSFFFAQDNHLWCKEIDGDTVLETMIMPLKLHLQKIVTVPQSTENKVFLFGGAKDDEAKEVVSN